MAFQMSKDSLTSSPLLVHFDQQLKLIPACDASAYGAGAMLAHQIPDGSEQPIGYICLGKEGLGLCIWSKYIPFIIV